MTISADLVHESWFGNGVATVFPYTMRIIDANDVSIYFFDIPTQVLTSVNPSQYTLTGVGPTRAGGGNITLLSPIPSTTQMFLYRVPDFLQTTSIVNQGGFLPQVLETALDELTVQAQFLRYEELRSIKFPLFDEADVVLPRVINRAGRYLAFNGDGSITTAAGLIDGNQVEGVQDMIVSSVHAGATIIWDSTNISNWTLSATAPASTEVLMVQWNTAAIKVTPEAGATLVCAYTVPGAVHNGSALRYSNIHVRCVRNSTGSAAEWLLSGLTAIIA